MADFKDRQLLVLIIPSHGPYCVFIERLPNWVIFGTQDSGCD